MSDRVAPALPQLPPRSERPVAIVGVTVIPMTGPKKLVDHTVVITDGRITALGPQELVDTQGAEVIDATGRSLMPGLMDSHMHLNDVHDAALFLAAGVTRVRNMGGRPGHLAYARLVEQGGWAGPRLHSASTFIDGLTAAGKRHTPGAVVLTDPAAEDGIESLCPMRRTP
ncbi:amidohydrolase family protein [Amycolatopsis sulphurea]|uniref:amidohydrolase family protein n=1 Tax=Amycolatopsis sulphurea TaxID=76022 RepID=UPI000BF9CEE5|nr:amidohydrolase family protein [Amycolatopsis sulphurea]